MMAPTPRVLGSSESTKQGETPIKSFSSLDWFKRLDFYQYGVVYMCVRIGTNVTAVIF